MQPTSRRPGCCKIPVTLTMKVTNMHNKTAKHLYKTSVNVIREVLLQYWDPLNVGENPKRRFIHPLIFVSGLFLSAIANADPIAVRPGHSIGDLSKPEVLLL